MMDVMIGSGQQMGRGSKGAGAFETGSSPVSSATSNEVSRPKRRRFKAAYKSRILKQADGCSKPGELGALLRREGLYSSHLSKWRQRLADGSLGGLAPKKRGPKPNPDKHLLQENVRLRRTSDRLRRKLERAEVIISYQKNSRRSWA